MTDRFALADAAHAIARLGLASGSSGNLSLKVAGGMLITPSAIPYPDLTPEMMAFMPFAADDGAYEGAWRPSSEWRFHRDIYRARPDAGAIVHHHAPYTTALSMARRELPAAHYMIARFGGAPIRCAAYALFGTAELSDAVVAALEGRTGCLMANHGGVVLAADITRAVAAAAELEALARDYILSLAAGGPVLLSEAEVAAAAAQFATAYRPNVPAPAPQN